MSRSSTEEDIGTVLLLAAEAGTGETIAGFVRQLGYRTIEGDGVEPDIVVLVGSADQLPTAPKIDSPSGYAPPTIVFGPSGAGVWRKAALESGAFACLSLDAPPEERASLLQAASRFRQLQQEVQTIRSESNEIITSLLTTYGDEAHKHKESVEERKEAQEHLDRIQRRIIRSIL